ncbi:MAG TPA: MarR family transcriptional regulator [Steroidobacteraceae bacterium]|nr:MarR family transcriptional regulator [Steroidobacteraceae bacterium]
MDRHQYFGFLLRDVSQRYTARFEQHAREISLTLMQCKVLVHLDKNEGISQARLAQLTGIEPMMMVRLLNRMEKERFLERRSDPADRRARRLYLTEQARPLVDEIWRLAARTRAEMFANVSRQDRDTFVRILELAQQNLGAPAQLQVKS